MSLLLEAVFENSLDLESKAKLLSLFEENIWLSPKAEKCHDLMRSRVKSCFSSPKTRLEGLIGLNSFLDRSSDQAFIEDSSIWCQNCLDAIKFGDRSGKILACGLLIRIVNHMPSYADVWRETAHSFAPLLVETVCGLDFDPSLATHVYSALAACLSAFPGPCGPKKQLMDKFIIKRVNEANSGNLSILAKCYSKLYSCGGAGNEGINHRTAWSELMMRSLLSVDSFLGIYKSSGISLPPISQLEESELEPFFPPFDANNISTTALDVVFKFEFLSSVVCHMLTTKTSVQVSIPVTTILNLVAKTCSIDLNEFSSISSVDVAAVLAIVPSLQSNALRLLDALIIACKTTLGVHANFINQLIGRVLNITCSTLDKKQYISSRIVCYRVLLNWTVTLGSMVGFTSQAVDKLLLHIMNDVKQGKDMIKLQRVTSKALNKKSKGKSMKSLPMDENRKINDEAEVEICESALKALSGLIVNSSVYLSTQQYDLLSGFTLSELLNICREHDSLTGSYSKVCCRKAFFAVLQALILTPSLSPTFPMETAIVLFNEGYRLESNYELKSFCNESISLLNCLSHPRLPVRQMEVTISCKQMDALDEDEERKVDDAIQRNHVEDKQNHADDGEGSTGQAVEEEVVSKVTEKEAEVTTSTKTPILTTTVIEKVLDPEEQQEAGSDEERTESGQIVSPDVIELDSENSDDNNVGGAQKRPRPVEEARDEEPVLEAKAKKSKISEETQEKADCSLNDMIGDFVDNLVEGGVTLTQ